MKEVRRNKEIKFTTVKNTGNNYNEFLIRHRESKKKVY